MDPERDVVFGHEFCCEMVAPINETPIIPRRVMAAIRKAGTTAPKVQDPSPLTDYR
jgi:hypothetical protein